MVPSTYRLGAAHLLRLAGIVVVGLGLVWIAATLLGVDGRLRGALALVTVVVVVALATAFARAPRVLILDDVGYRVRWVRGVGRDRATWRQVADVIAQSSGSTAVMVFKLNDGASTTVPLTLLGTRQLQAQRDVHDRLNAAHGYRRLDQP